MSGPPAPSRLRGWLAHVVRTSIRRSNSESTENTPTKTPTGDNVSRFVGGKGGDDFAEDWSAKESDEGDALCEAGNDGMAQYALHGKGSLSGLRI
jgi:hypothetical protein